MVRWLRLWTWRQWLCLRRRSRRRGYIAFFCILAIVSLIFSVISFSFAFRHQLFDTFVKCQNRESLDYIAAYCQAYRAGEITGSLCQPLCETSQVQFTECTDFHAGKRVSIMSCTDICLPGQTIPAVLKYPNDNISLLLSNHPLSFPHDGEEADFNQHTGEMIRSMLSWEFGFLPFSSEADMIEVMWEKDSSKYTGSLAAQRQAFRTLMMLMDQTEYRAVRALESSGIVPHTYGTCGPMYLQEWCPPGVLDEMTASLAGTKPVPMPWGQKASAIIQLLKLLQRLELYFPQVLHLCDVKGTNFGVSANGAVKLIDGDSMFFHSRMMDTFQMTQCQTHEECHFFDCRGWCHTETGRCSSIITNNNFQTVCQDVLSSKLPKVLGGGSLFSAAPASIAPKLQAALKECLAHSSVEQGDVQVHKPPLSLLSSLIELLEQSPTDDDQGR